MRNDCSWRRSDARLSSSNVRAWSRSPRARNASARLQTTRPDAGSIAELTGDREGLLVQRHRPVVVPTIVSYGPQFAQRTVRAFSVAQIPIQGQARLVQLDRPVVVPVSCGQDTRHEKQERPPARLRLGRLAVPPSASTASNHRQPSPR